ncbi:MAG: beta-galactosidase [Ruminococcus flavefaciens]|nr:beta-galactosidase [Ruminococcus flavefaciens]MCM1229713.1 beta-galactosidase [Ruminococcus flavefaciens]
MRIGVDYYPEQWDSSLWEKDAGIMAGTGVKVVRIGESVWSGIEPQDGVFDFSWLDEVIRIFAKYAIKVVMSIPTDCPPLWLYEKHPEIVHTDMGGNKIRYGLNHRSCTNLPVFRAYALRMADELVRHYVMNLTVTAWQIDNRLPANQCTCDVCRNNFRRWLIEKHGTLENINRAFGNAVFGEYSDISQIQPPSDYPESLQNPTLCLEWYRFTSFSTADFAKEIMLVVKKHCPKIPVTANADFGEDNPDLYKLYDMLDFVSYNNYPPVRIPDNPNDYYSHAFSLDLMRGIKEKNFRIMEQLSGAYGKSPSPKAGMIMGYSLQAMIHGADTVMHCRWRTALTGAQQFAHGIIDHSNVPNRRFFEFSELCKKTEQISVLDNTFIISDIAILYSSESEKALDIQPQTENFSYIHQLRAFHSAFTHFGANVDVIPPDSDLTRYKLVIAPSLFVNNKKETENIYRYVINGGTLVLTCRSGVKDENNNCIMDSLPTVFKELIGAEVAEYNPIGDEIRTIRDFAGNEFTCGQWCDVLRLTTAKAYAEYNSGEYWCMPAVTLNRYCNGVAYYVGTVCQADFYESFASNLMMQTRIPKLKGLPRGVEVTTRTNGTDEYICFFNNSESSVSIPLPKPMYSVISSCGTDKLDLKAFDVDIVRK